MPPNPLRIAILKADTPIGQTLAKYGSYTGVFTSLLHKAADASHIPRESIEITGWDVVNGDAGEEEEDGRGEKEEVNGGGEFVGGEWGWKRRRGYPRMGDVDGVLITGSRFNAFDNDPWILHLVDFVKEVLAQDRVKIVGVCYGHQIVGRALGAKVARSESGAWEVSVCQVVQTEKGRELFGGKDVLSIFQMHKDLVYHYPQGVEHLGSSGPCEVQGMYLPKRVITVQGHPEFTEAIVAELLERRRKQGIFVDDIYKEAMARVGKPHDGVLVAQGFLKFLMGD